MVLEVALIDVNDPAGFEAAYRSARPILAETPGCRSVRMTHCIESPERFVLLVEWDSVAAHEDNFRATDRFTRWRAAIGPYFATPPRVEHMTDLDPPPASPERAHQPAMINARSFDQLRTHRLGPCPTQA